MIDFFNHRTIKWKNNKVIMIDQTKLPEETIYFEASNYRDIAHAIKTMIINATNIIELQIFRYREENTAGIIIRNINGLVIPPVKKNKSPSCNIS